MLGELVAIQGAVPGAIELLLPYSSLYSSDEMNDTDMSSFMAKGKQIGIFILSSP